MDAALDSADGKCALGPEDRRPRSSGRWTEDVGPGVLQDGGSCIAGIRLAGRGCVWGTVVSQSSESSHAETDSPPPGDRVIDSGFGAETEAGTPTIACSWTSEALTLVVVVALELRCRWCRCLPELPCAVACGLISMFSAPPSIQRFAGGVSGDSWDCEEEDVDVEDEASLDDETDETEWSGITLVRGV